MWAVALVEFVEYVIDLTGSTDPGMGLSKSCFFRSCYRPTGVVCYAGRMHPNAKPARANVNHLGYEQRMKCNFGRSHSDRGYECGISHVELANIVIGMVF